ncbi:NUDIX domain-containing protein [Acidaminobacter sp. JC074]|uniref:NUDIX hydrolase n=1 Tax=Acidaminobacter sp. JC074 TaxID=2530199 RepID=UPI001F107AF5|nr:NUDIX hydrolase [Acidaminobacter sp. JC074]MCH4886277.1 NUDIX domain-containing protein [Acidaminobacter sp. JC074]
MDYIGNLRKYIGTQPIIMCGANVIIENEHGLILLHHRTDRDWWGLPGGAMELGESLEETAKREVFEEVNLNCNMLKLFNVYSGQELYYKYPDGNEVYNVTTTYISDDYSGEITVEKTEGRDARFFDIDEIPKNLSSTITCILGDYLEYRRKV